LLISLWRQHSFPFLLLKSSRDHTGSMWIIQANCWLGNLIKSEKSLTTVPRWVDWITRDRDTTGI
jgi:hypothetical protein